jgi:hypothetical protein
MTTSQKLSVKKSVVSNLSNGKSTFGTGSLSSMLGWGTGSLSSM